MPINSRRTGIGERRHWCGLSLYLHIRMLFITYGNTEPRMDAQAAKIRAMAIVLGAELLDLNRGRRVDEEPTAAGHEAPALSR